MKDSTRLTLIQRVSNGNDEKSWEEFTDIYRRYIIGFVLKNGVQFEEAEDIAQKILIKLWKKMPEFEYKPAECRFRSWVAIISRSIIKDHFELKQNKMSDLMVEEQFSEASVNAEIELLALNEWKEFISVMAWEKVSKLFKKDVIDVFLQFSKKSVTEIAEKTGLAENTVYVYHKRVKTALQREIQKLNYELG